MENCSNRDSDPEKNFTTRLFTIKGLGREIFGMEKFYHTNFASESFERENLGKDNG